MVAELTPVRAPAFRHAQKSVSLDPVTYCSPQVASVGLYRAKAELGFDVKVPDRFLFIWATAKRIALGEPRICMIKTVL